MQEKGLFPQLIKTTQIKNPISTVAARRDRVNLNGWKCIILHSGKYMWYFPYQIPPPRTREGCYRVIFVVIILVPKILLTEINDLVLDLQLPFQVWTFVLSTIELHTIINVTYSLQLDWVAYRICKGSGYKQIVNRHQYSSPSMATCRAPTHSGQNGAPSIENALGLHGSFVTFSG